MSRKFTSFAENTPKTKALVDELPSLKGDVESYRARMIQLGAYLADSLIPKLGGELSKDICVICTVEDADFLARGVIEELDSQLGIKTKMICMWNQRIKSGAVSISPVLRTYEENYDKDNAVFVVVKSIISGACVVKTNLTKAISSADPKRVFIVAPVMLEGAEERLSREFPVSVASRFEFVNFATDSEKSADGEEVIPGIGGSIYELLGLGDSTRKNKYVPAIVRERRKKEFPNMAVA